MDAFPGRLRYRLILDKFQVTKIERGVMGQKLTLSLGKGVTAIIPDCPPEAEVLVGDFLTFYTEVLAK
jgi:hypothetical protein